MESVAKDSVGIRKSAKGGLDGAIVVDTEQARSHLHDVVRSAVETRSTSSWTRRPIGACRAQRYECSTDRQDTRAGSYDRKLQTKAGPIGGEYPYVHLDGIWLKRSWGGEVKNVAVLIAIGVERRRLPRGAGRGGGEDAESWRTFLRGLKERGLSGVRLFISDKGAWAWLRRSASSIPNRLDSVASFTGNGGAAGQGARGDGAQGRARPGGPRGR